MGPAGTGKAGRPEGGMAMKLNRSSHFSLPVSRCDVRYGIDHQSEAEDDQDNDGGCGGPRPFKLDHGLIVDFRRQQEHAPPPSSLGVMKELIASTKQSRQPSAIPGKVSGRMMRRNRVKALAPRMPQPPQAKRSGARNRQSATAPCRDQDFHHADEHTKRIVDEPDGEEMTPRFIKAPLTSP